MIPQAFEKRPFVEHSGTFRVTLSVVTLRLQLATTLVTYQVLILSMIVAILLHFESTVCV